MQLNDVYEKNDENGDYDIKKSIPTPGGFPTPVRKEYQLKSTKDEILFNIEIRKERKYLFNESTMYEKINSSSNEENKLTPEEYFLCMEWSETPEDIFDFISKDGKGQIQHRTKKVVSILLDLIRARNIKRQRVLGLNLLSFLVTHKPEDDIFNLSGLIWLMTSNSLSLEFLNITSDNSESVSGNILFFVLCQMQISSGVKSENGIIGASIEGLDSCLKIITELFGITLTNILRENIGEIRNFQFNTGFKNDKDPVKREKYRIDLCANRLINLNDGTESSIIESAEELSCLILSKNRAYTLNKLNVVNIILYDVVPFFNEASLPNTLTRLDISERITRLLLTCLIDEQENNYEDFLLSYNDSFIEKQIICFIKAFLNNIIQSAESSCCFMLIELFMLIRHFCNAGLLLQELFYCEEFTSLPSGIELIIELTSCGMEFLSKVSCSKELLIHCYLSIYSVINSIVFYLINLRSCNSSNNNNKVALDEAIDRLFSQITLDVLTSTANKSQMCEFYLLYPFCFSYAMAFSIPQKNKFHEVLKAVLPDCLSITFCSNNNLLGTIGIIFLSCVIQNNLLNFEDESYTNIENHLTEKIMNELNASSENQQNLLIGIPLFESLSDKAKELSDVQMEIYEELKERKLRFLNNKLVLVKDSLIKDFNRNNSVISSWFLELCSISFFLVKKNPDQRIQFKQILREKIVLPLFRCAQTIVPSLLTQNNYKTLLCISKGIAESPEFYSATENFSFQLFFLNIMCQVKSYKFVLDDIESVSNNLIQASNLIGKRPTLKPCFFSTLSGFVEARARSRTSFTKFIEPDLSELINVHDLPVGVNGMLEVRDDFLIKSKMLKEVENYYFSLKMWLELMIIATSVIRDEEIKESPASSLLKFIVRPELLLGLIFKWRLNLLSIGVELKNIVLIKCDTAIKLKENSLYYVGAEVETLTDKLLLCLSNLLGEEISADLVHYLNKELATVSTNFSCGIVPQSVTVVLLKLLHQIGAAPQDSLQENVNCCTNLFIKLSRILFSSAFFSSISALSSPRGNEILAEKPTVINVLSRFNAQELVDIVSYMFSVKGTYGVFGWLFRGAETELKRRCASKEISQDTRQLFESLLADISS